MEEEDTIYRDHIYMIIRGGVVHRGGLPAQLGRVTRLGGLR